MAAVLGMDAQAIEENIKDFQKVQIANYNCPGQIVISGETKEVEKAADKLKEAGAKRCIMLNVSGPFHSQMLQGAGEKLSKELDQIEIHDLAIPYVANVNGEIVSDSSKIKPYLVQQVSSSVRWEQSVRNMIEWGVDTFIEIGPGKTLAGFNRKIDREIKTFNVETLADIDKILAEV